MGLDVKKIGKVAGDAAEEVIKNKEAQKVIDKAAGAIEKKTKVDIPDAKDIAKML